MELEKLREEELRKIQESKKKTVKEELGRKLEICIQVKKLKKTHVRREMAKMMMKQGHLSAIFFFLAGKRFIFRFGKGESRRSISNSREQR